MHTRGNSISVTWVRLLIWGMIVVSVSTARGDDSETVASLKQRNLRQEAALKAANAEIEQLTNEVNRLQRKLEAIRRELDKEPIPVDPDVLCYNDLKDLLRQIRDKRSGKSTDSAELRKRADDISKKYLARLKNEATRDHPIKQHLLWSIRDDLPMMMKNDLSITSKQENAFSNRLDEIEKLLQSVRGDPGE